MLHVPTIYIAPSPLGGRGVFIGEDLPVGSMIEICPVIILSKKDRKIIHKTGLHDYYFLWGKKERKAAIALGYGSLYNHSYAPNAQLLPDIPAQQFIIESIKPIKAGEEITLNYNGGDDQSPLWFDTKKDPSH